VAAGSEVDRKETAEWWRRAARWTGKRQQRGGGEQRGGDGLWERKCDFFLLKKLGKKLGVRKEKEERMKEVGDGSF